MSFDNQGIQVGSCSINGSCISSTPGTKNYDVTQYGHVIDSGISISLMLGIQPTLGEFAKQAGMSGQRIRSSLAQTNSFSPSGTSVWVCVHTETAGTYADRYAYTPRLAIFMIASSQEL